MLGFALQHRHDDERKHDTLSFVSTIRLGQHGTGTSIEALCFSRLTHFLGLETMSCRLIKLNEITTRRRLGFRLPFLCKIALATRLDGTGTVA